MVKSTQRVSDWSSYNKKYQIFPGYCIKFGGVRECQYTKDSTVEEVGCFQQAFQQQVGWGTCNLKVQRLWMCVLQFQNRYNPSI